jgi:rod shape determining protein RodA
MEVQTSEIVKLCVIILIAHWLEKKNGDSLKFIKDIIPLAIITGVPFILVLKQPDLGTAIVFLCIFIGMLWMGNVKISHAIIGTVTIAIFIGAITALYFVDFELFSVFVKEHQLARIQAFLDPINSDPSKTWHVRNAMWAVSSGQMSGEGFLNGKYVQGEYVPYAYADSIFAVVGEEFGFIGSAILLLLYFLLIYRMIRIAMECEDLSGSYMIIGITSMITLQIFENIAMHTGLMPMTGIALPFMSYGGSSLFTNMIGIGLVLSVKLHSKKEEEFV